MKLPWKSTAVVSQINHYFLQNLRFMWYFYKHYDSYRGREGTLFISFWTFKHFIATLDLKWLLHIFNCMVSNYQTATWWTLPPSGISIWLIVNGMLISVLIENLILDFITIICLTKVVDLSFLHSTITSKLTNQIHKPPKDIFSNIFCTINSRFFWSLLFF